MSSPLPSSQPYLKHLLPHSFSRCATLIALQGDHANSLLLLYWPILCLSTGVYTYTFRSETSLFGRRTTWRYKSVLACAWDLVPCSEQSKSPIVCDGGIMWCWGCWPYGYRKKCLKPCGSFSSEISHFRDLLITDDMSLVDSLLSRLVCRRMLARLTLAFPYRDTRRNTGIGYGRSTCECPVAGKLVLWMRIDNHCSSHRAGTYKWLPSQFNPISHSRCVTKYLPDDAKLTVIKEGIIII